MTVPRRDSGAEGQRAGTGGVQAHEPRGGVEASSSAGVGKVKVSWLGAW